jgi:hypothetical protein
MDGPAHYRKAEELAAKVAEYLGQGDGQDTVGVWAAAAQVHATLSVAATSERVQTGSTHPEAARTSRGSSGHRYHRTFSFFRRPPES